MDELKIYLFGSPHVELQGRFMDIRLRKALAELAYLAVTRRVHTKDTLATLFWPKADQRNGRANLRRTVYRLRKVVGKKALDVTPETIGMHPDADPWIDI
jgi:DNA-binding SARP family transcriptional activator